MLSALPEYALDLAFGCVAIVAVLVMEPPADRRAWLRLLLGALVAVVIAGQIASLLDWTRAARNILIVGLAFFADGLIEVGLRIRKGMARDPVGLLKALFKIRSGRVGEVPDDVLGPKRKP